MSRKASKNQNGFTIIELLIATIVFSVLLIVMLAAFIRTGELFYKGASMTKTQNDARNIVQSIASDIQFTAGVPNNLTANHTTNPSGIFCIGQHRYRYQIGVQAGQGANYGLARDTVSAGCPPLTGSGSLPVQTASDNQMLDAGMQLNNLNITCSGAPIGVCSVNIHVIFYGLGSTPDIFSTSDGGYTSATAYLSPSAQCNGSLNDTSLCATVDYDSTVLENN
ncbi:MAG TPA: prepilin-type N-terminal cleavage/methylation domain-containing protein [Candidatus Saccharimonadales bacterium]|nr:prepilin-type N-terminal cleavage/methylation domain-containing protein [Candidatus Saccharimonadales bacterium]